MKRPQARRAAALLALPASLAGAVADADEPHGFIRNSRKRRLRGQPSQAGADELPLQPRSVDLHPPHQQQQRQLNPVSDQYLAAHPYYPNHDILACLDDGNFPSWMAWEGGYAEAHLFQTGEACCERWFPEVMGCFDSVAEGRIEAAADAMVDAIGKGRDAGGADAPNVDAIVANVLSGQEDEGWALKRPSGSNEETATAGNGAGTLLEMASNMRPTSGNERPAETGALEGMTYFPTTTEDLAAANRPANERPVANNARPAGLTGPSGGAHDAADSFSHIRPANSYGVMDGQQYLGAWQVAQERGHGAPDPEMIAMSKLNHGADTFPTSACGHGWEDASHCTILCLNGAGCPGGMACHPGVPCPASQVAAAMGEAGSGVLNMVQMSEELRENSIELNVCGMDYGDAESKCRAGAPLDDGSPGLGFADDFVDCEDYVCPEGLHCYGGILCPIPPTISPRPTRSPVPDYSFNHAPTEEGGHGKKIVAYYAAWQLYDRSKLAQPRNLNYHMITRINYAFFQTDVAGNLWGTDDFADPTILFGSKIERQATPAGVDGGLCSPQTIGSNDSDCYCHYVGPGVVTCSYHAVEDGLIHLAHTNGVEVYPSIGGWTLSDAFPAMAASQSGRETFAQSCIELILAYDFDGIDIDWEYPGYAAHSGGPADTENFVLLLETVRSALDALGSQTGRYYGLTAALPCGPANIANQDIEAVAAILDELNLMTYDFHGSWDPISGHNSPLYDQPGDPESGWSVDGCVHNWVGENSPIANDALRKEYHGKVNIGIPLYGRSFLGATEMYAPQSGNDEYSWAEDKGTPQYFNILAMLEAGELTSVRDDVTKTQWAYFNNGHGMISFDDERSICDKTEYAMDHGLGGFIVWEISGDLLDDFHQPLMEAVNRKLALPDTDCESFGTVYEPAAFDAQAYEPQESTGYSTRPIAEEPIERGDKTEIVGMAVPPAPAPGPAVMAEVAPASWSNASPYTIDTSSFGPNSVAAESCTGGCPSGSSCVGNASGGRLIQDTECAACNAGQTWWPCDVEGLCWCWLDGTARIAPAPPSGLEVETTGQFYTVCDDILTRELFHAIAPEAKEPYTYEGLCDAILSYNARHTEKAFGMGDDYQRAAELAAFLGNTLHESDEFKAAREYLMCGDNIVVDGETYCKPCDPGSFDWATKTCQHSLVSGTSDFNEYCQPSSVPPEACLCGNGSGEGGALEGYVAAKHLFFGRGSIQTSWNYNYIGASIALTGSPDTFCDNPDLIATTPEYIWGAGLHFWMEHVKEGTTSHTEVLGGDFGGSLNNINGGLECPAHGGWHVDAVKMRLNRYCHAARVLNLPNLMRLTNCAGLTESMDTCLSDGMCEECLHFVGSVPGDHPKWVAPASAPTPSGYTQVDEPANDAPLCPDGLMPWDDNPDCCVPNPNVIGDGACDPSAPYNTPVCGFDGGDCCKGTCDQSSAFGCTTKEGDSLGEYGPFGFYCTDPSQGSDVINHILCDANEKYRLGDGMCNPTLNTPECNYDGGDCCRETCDDYFSFYPCGSGVQGYVCLDPRFAAASDPTHRPTRRPTGLQVDSLGGICPMDNLQCPNGQYMSRNPNRGCAFDPCPPQFDSSEECNDTQKECPDGTFVGRNPGNKCKFFPCPAKPQSGKHTFASSISAAMQHGKDSYKDDDKDDGKSPAHEAWEQAKPASGGVAACSDDMRECSDGSFVGRNPRNGCRFVKCPVVESESNSLAAGISASFAHNKPSSNKQCKEDARECSDGSFVERNPANQCRFYECPVAESGSKKPNSLAAGISASFAQNKPKPMSNEKCSDDKRECRDGSFVERNPANQCRIHDCPPPSSESAFDSLSASLSSLGQDSECTDEVKPCPGGSFVAQDPDNGCAFFPCPDKMPVSMAASMHAKDSSQKCTTELKRCPNGTFVAQDPDDDCNYFPCGEMAQMDAAAWASAGGGAPHKKEAESDASDWARGHEQNAYVGSGAQSQHRKKNRSG